MARASRVVEARLRSWGWVTTTSLVVVAVIALGALFGPLMPGYDPETQNLSGAQLGLLATDSAGGSHLLGTNSLGVDTLSQLIQGARISLGIAIGSILISAILGTALGAMAGYFGGFVDRIVGIVVDVTLAVPRVLVLIPIIAVLGSSIELLLVLIGLTGWPLFARVVRAQVMSLMHRDYVRAAISMGASDVRVLATHILPNTVNSIIVMASLEFGAVIVVESGLSYLGLGVRPPATSWGLMINNAQEYIMTQPLLMLVPSLALVILVLATNLGSRAFTSESRALSRRTLLNGKG